MTVHLRDGDRVLFLGDSITDAGRDRSADDLGTGYAALVAAWFTATHPGHGVSFTNRGVSGFRVRDLLARWEEDCLAQQPTVVSVMIGVNDTWRRYDKDDPTSTEDFERDYRAVLVRTADRLDVRLLMIEPFLLPVKDEQESWREDLDPKIGAVRRLAAEFGATLVPADGCFAAAAATRPAASWAGDGVHPTLAGHALLARQWLATTSYA